MFFTSRNILSLYIQNLCLWKCILVYDKLMTQSSVNMFMCILWIWKNFGEIIFSSLSHRLWFKSLIFLSFIKSLFKLQWLKTQKVIQIYYRNLFLIRTAPQECWNSFLKVMAVWKNYFWFRHGNKFAFALHYYKHSNRKSKL